MTKTRRSIHLAFRLSLALVTGLTWAGLTWASPDKRADAEAMTMALAGLNNAYQKAAPSARSRALQRLLDTAAERQALLMELIEDDPGAVLRTAVPARIRNGMPAEVRAFVEQHVDLEGELEVKYEDYADGSHRLRHFLDNGGDRISLHFKAQPPGLLSGTPAQVRGVLLDGTMAVESGEGDVLTLALDGGADGGTNGGTAPELPNTLGEQRTLVLLVNFQDDPTNQPWTHGQVADVVFGHTNDFFLENSFGQTWLTGDVHGWYTIPVDSAGCDINRIMDNANQLAIADAVDLTTYQRIVYFHPQNGCGWSGVASLGGEPATALMNGTIDARVVGHELGHTLGLFHAHGLECGGHVLGADCQNVEYGDPLDIMGQRIAHFNGFNKERMGWLGVDDVLSVETDGSYNIAGYAVTPGADPKVLKILKSVDPLTGQQTWYYVESRQAIGFDSTIATDASFDSDNILNGVVIRTGTELDGQSSNLLDMTPGSDVIFDWFDAALTVDQSYVDEEAGITITTDWTDGTGAGVSVTMGPQVPVCVPSNPLLILTPGESDWVYAGTAFSYVVTVTNYDNMHCSSVDFELAASVPSGWTASFGESVLNLAPGASVTTTLDVTSAANASEGFYRIGVSVSDSTDGSQIATGSVTHVVQAPVTEPPSNAAPIATDDNVTIGSKSAVVIPVLANDSDPDGDDLSIVSFNDGAKGSISDNGDGTLTYTPGKRFKTSDSFSYTISDGVATAVATVNVSLEEGDSGGSTPGGGKGGRKK